MRCIPLAVAVLMLAGVTVAQDVTAPKRYGIELDLVKYPQQSPQQAMQTIAKLLDERHLDYLVAHLADPAFVDAKVEEYKKLYTGPEGAVELVAFNQLVKEIAAHFRQDPTLTDELRRFAKEGKWTEDKAKKTANAQLPDVASRRVYLAEVKGRWYLQNQR